MKKAALSCVAVFCVTMAWGQHHVEISVANGISRISSVNSNEEESASRAHIKDLNKWSISANAHYNYSFKNVKLRTGLSYSLLQGETKEQFHVYPYIPGTGYEYDYEFHIVRKAHYLRIPLMFAYQADKLEIALGLYGGYLFSNSYWASGFTNSDPNLFQGGGNNLSKFDAGIGGEIRYPLDDKFDLMIAANAGLVDISNGTEQGAQYFVYGLEPHQRTLKNRQLLIGVSYHLF